MSQNNNPKLIRSSTMLSRRNINLVWIILISLTLTSIFVAEQTPETALSIITVCFIIAIKGQLVIDKLIGLRFENQKIRAVMLSYFYILPVLFIIGFLFPEAFLVFAIKP
ncbi:MAG: hypothetical protein QNK26_17515 [Moritella sp.]|uniref:hypothetical protein n=1 Tax=Moritella sp. TaxID=78556 RepID=UPI0029BB9327|nr:hypothetical protein [Moritella sp.]MDX2322386.1 hypothetical protein [Moritella sp.]